MMWKIRPRRKCNLAQWHLWFAWYPIRVDETTAAWLMYVERKGSMTLMADSEGYPYEHWEFQYRLLDTVK